MLKYKSLLNIPLRRHITTSNNILEHLENKSLLRVSGPEVSNFLQGLITNDVEHLKSGPSCMYAMFLNNAGRILYDSIIYRTHEVDTYLIECDKHISPALQKHMKLYRVRRKIDITSLSDEFKIYVLFNNAKPYHYDESSNQISENTTIMEPLSKPSLKSHNDVFLYRDPRMAMLGSRIIARSDLNINEKLGNSISIQESPNFEGNYRWLRYSLGVGEGIQDLPPGDCFPLECNCDYLHGVSFHKGCYIGQELTARVHHVGAIRKRLMPIYFTKIPSKLPDPKIIHDKVNLGKFRGIEKDVGLGLLRIDKALSVKEINFGTGIGVTFIPNWWPTTVSKEKITVLKT